MRESTVPVPAPAERTIEIAERDVVVGDDTVDVDVVI